MPRVARPAPTVAVDPLIRVWFRITEALRGKADMSALETKQNLLESGTNIKTINGQSILGSGDIPVASSGGNSYFPNGW